jgi:hypothetical protein
MRLPQQLLRSSDARALGDSTRRSMAVTLKSIGIKTVKPDELARCVLRFATEGERDPVRLHDMALRYPRPLGGKQADRIECPR